MNEASNYRGLKIKRTNFLTLLGWMRYDLDLSGNELIIYGVIYGYSQNGGEYSGGKQYLADWANVDVRTVYNILKKLEGEGLIVKVDYVVDDVRHKGYRAIEPDEVPEESEEEKTEEIEEEKPEKISDSDENLKPEKISDKTGKNFRLNRKKFPTHIYINNINNINNIKEGEISQKICEIYNSSCPSLPPVKNMTKKRQRLIATLVSNHSLDEIKKAFAMAEASDFLTGNNDRGWVADFTFLIDEDNFTKLIEGSYKNKPKHTNPKKKTGFNNFSQRDDDLDALEKKLLGF